MWGVFDAIKIIVYCHMLRKTIGGRGGIPISEIKPCAAGIFSTAVGSGFGKGYGSGSGDEAEVEPTVTGQGVAPGSSRRGKPPMAYPTIR
jgi:hypothetical protein